MTWLDLVTVKATPTDSRSQRSKRSFQTTEMAAAGMQPKSSARRATGGGLSKALPARATATEV